jgi:hypothetical protein
MLLKNSKAVILAIFRPARISQKVAQECRPEESENRNYFNGIGGESAFNLS